eukprot:CAMPEP_0184714670 /NCGR_PEP_ID=MMETSP0314-20130426/4752_1 /TAXON_ID=38298 /ORGANISM="Rhodella maculata, Strain CCMP 736" /LENGTH=440 /DNA_ID=CAMNT_0027177633 /DNA_START=321 /DNA_END=1643 /DNA_ORIENTATION=-
MMAAGEQAELPERRGRPRKVNPEISELPKRRGRPRTVTPKTSELPLLENSQNQNVEGPRGRPRKAVEDLLPGPKVSNSAIGEKKRRGRPQMTKSETLKPEFKGESMNNVQGADKPSRSNKGGRPRKFGAIVKEKEKVPDDWRANQQRWLGTNEADARLYGSRLDFVASETSPAVKNSRKTTKNGFRSGLFPRSSDDFFIEDYSSGEEQYTDENSGVSEESALGPRRGSSRGFDLNNMREASDEIVSAPDDSRFLARPPRNRSVRNPRTRDLPSEKNDEIWKYRVDYAIDYMGQFWDSSPKNAWLKPFKERKLDEQRKGVCKICDGTGMMICEYCKGAGFVEFSKENRFKVTFKQSEMFLPQKVAGSNLFHCPLCGGLRKERCINCYGKGVPGELPAVEKLLITEADLEKGHKVEVSPMFGVRIIRGKLGRGRKRKDQKPK